MSKQESSESVALGCLSMLVAAVLVPPWRAWCLIRVYDWHLRPVFGGPHLGVLQVWAFCVFWGLLEFRIPPDVERKQSTFLDAALRLVLIGFVGPLLSLFVAWCLK